MDMSDYVRDGRYDPDQLDVIKRGLKEGYDVSVYARPDLDWEQMDQVLAGLRDRVEVKVYADPKYSPMQMAQFRMGLNYHCDVSWYADEKLSALQMAQIRMGLENGVDVSWYAGEEFTPAQMDEVRMALEAGIEDSMALARISNPHHTPEQMALERWGFEHGVDVEPYVVECNDLTPAQAWQVHIGLRAGLDVRPYTDARLSVRHMIVLRQGLEAGIDVTAYAKPSLPSGEIERQLRQLKAKPTEARSPTRGPRK